MSGGKWVVENGAIVGSQDIPGNGGIVITDEQFGHFEVVLEMNNDFGPDSGLFLRSTEDGKAWQAMIDYHKGGNVMGIYGEGLGGKPSVRNYSFLDTPDQIQTNAAPFPLPILSKPGPGFGSTANGTNCAPASRTIRRPSRPGSMGRNSGKRKD